MSAVEVADRLRAEGFTAHSATRRFGVWPLTELKVRYTGHADPGRHDLNDVVLPNRAYAYIDVDAAVWILTDSPVDGTVGVVYVSASDAKGMSDRQKAALAALAGAAAVKVAKPVKRPNRGAERPTSKTVKVDVTVTADSRGPAVTFIAPVDADEFRVEVNSTDAPKSGWETVGGWTACEPGEVVVAPLSESASRVRVAFRGDADVVAVSPVGKM